MDNSDENIGIASSSKALEAIVAQTFDSFDWVENTANQLNSAELIELMTILQRNVVMELAYFTKREGKLVLGNGISIPEDFPYPVEAKLIFDDNGSQHLVNVIAYDDFAQLILHRYVSLVEKVANTFSQRINRSPADQKNLIRLYDMSRLIEGMLSAGSLDRLVILMRFANPLSPLNIECSNCMERRRAAETHVFSHALFEVLEKKYPLKDIQYALAHVGVLLRSQLVHLRDNAPELLQHMINEYSHNPSLESVISLWAQDHMTSNRSAPQSLIIEWDGLTEELPLSGLEYVRDKSTSNIPAINLGPADGLEDSCDTKDTIVTFVYPDLDYIPENVIDVQSGELPFLRSRGGIDRVLFLN